MLTHVRVQQRAVTWRCWNGRLGFDTCARAALTGDLEVLQWAGQWVPLEL
jgi:hypothetical protein